MDEILTVAEIEARYPDEWVFLADTEASDELEVLRGRVLAHSKNRDEVDAVAIQSQTTGGAFFYMGRLPDGAAYLF